MDAATINSYPRPSLITSSTDAAHNGSFMSMGTSTINSERQIQPDQSELKTVPLSSRLIHPFKAIINRIGFSAVYGTALGCVPGLITLGTVGIATGVTGGVVGGILGGLVKLAKMVAGCPSEAHQTGIFLGGILGGVIALLPAIAVTAAASLAAFGVIASVSTVINILPDLFHAATWTRTEMDEWTQKINNNWLQLKAALEKWKNDNMGTEVLEAQ